METKTTMLLIACFTLSLLLVFDFYTKPAIAQLSIDDVSFGATHVDSTTYPQCEYISTSQVWCATDSGIKIWNPTTRSVVATLASGNTWDDIKCDLLCYSWDKVSTGVANLTSWTITTRQLVNTTLFTNNAGGQVSNGIGLAVGAGSNTLLLGIEGQLCGAGSDLKGVCIWDGIGWAFARFISDGSTNDSDFVVDIEWNGELATIADPSLNRAVVHHQDAVGNKRLYLLNLADSDTTFSTTEKCNTGVLAGTSNQIRIRVIDGYAYLPIGNQDIINISTIGSSPTCGVFTKSNPVDEAVISTIQYSSNDNVFVIGASSNNVGVVTSAVYLFNGTNFAGTTTFDRELKINMSSSTSGWIIHELWLHQSEGEIQVWQDSVIRIISGVLEETDPTDSSGGNSQNGRCGVGTVLDCIGDRSVSTAITGGQDITVVAGNLFCGIGLNATCSGTTQENGTGLLLMLITGTFFTVVILGAIATANTRFGAGISYTEIPKELWLFLVVGVVAFSWYMGWIPDIVFYSMVLGIVGLFSFGLYRHTRG